MHTGRRGKGRIQRLARGMLPVAFAIAGCTLLLMAVFAAHAAARPADPRSTLNIVLPKPSASVAEGPVGALVSIKATLQGTDSFQVGYATQNTGCQNGFTPVASASPQAPSADGTLALTFAWPQDAAAIGTAYYACLQDTTTSTTVIQSSQVYRVDDASAPSIQVQAAGTGTTGAMGTATITPGDSGVPMAAGGQATITGANFTPPGAALAAYLTYGATLSPAAIAGQSPLTTVGNAPIVSDGSGAFTTTVLLPQNTIGSSWYLQVVSTDGTAKLLPSLEAAAHVNIAVQPTITPSPPATRTVAPVASRVTQAGQPPASGGPSKRAIAGVVALSGLSIVLFIVGVLLLASTVSAPRRPAR